MSQAPILEGDHAQRFLLPHLEKTQVLFETALRTLDSRATCAITPAADLCLPHDVIRLAGGFATGCLVQWDCAVPIVPIDTTVNIDTSSIFWLDSEPTLTGNDFDLLRRRIEGESSYEWNFHKGNHFISLCRRRSDGRHGLVIHSNEKEFKYQFNGLMPVDGNWFMDSVRTFRRGGRYLRLLVGDKAILFCQIAKLMEPYNIVRHRFIASQLLGETFDISDDFHKHHYYMPTEQSVAIGCFLCDPGETVPIFSRAGEDIHIFEPLSGGTNVVNVDGRQALIVPHGWGKTMAGPVETVFDEYLLTINGQSFEVKPKVTLGVHPNLIVRALDPNADSDGSLYSRMKVHTPGRVVDSLQQLASYAKGEFAVHAS